MAEGLILNYKRQLFSPEELKTDIPISKEMEEIKNQRDKEISDVLRGKSNKKLLIIGPCSADRVESVIDYTKRLVPIQENIKDKIIIIPRVYTSKPRTICSDYKGMIHEPIPNKKQDILEGLKSMRLIHKKVLEETGFSCADEILYPEAYAYISDILSYATIGARTVESQEHRFIASALRIPVGMKNPLNGNISTMINAVKAAQSKNSFIYRGYEVESDGNELAHAILRGRVDENGINYPNYQNEVLELLNEKYFNGGYKNPAVIIDANHSNSGKRPKEQIRIIKEVIHMMKSNNDIQRMVKGFMVESYIEEGTQKIEEGIYGKSITDSCLGFKETEELVYEIAKEL